MPRLIKSITAALVIKKGGKKVARFFEKKNNAPIDSKQRPRQVVFGQRRPCSTDLGHYCSMYGV